MERTFKEFLKEVMAGPGIGNLNLTKSQKRVLNKISAAGDPNMAVNAIVNSNDNTNLMPAVKILAKLGYLTTEPAELGPHDEPTAISLTPTGEQAVEKENIASDPSLITPDEQEQGAPQTPPPSDQLGMGGIGTPPPPTGGMGGELGAELGNEELPPEDEISGELGTGEEIPPEAGNEGEPGAEGELGGELGAELGNEELPPEEVEPEAEEQNKLKKKGIKLQLSSMFHDINDLAKFIKT